MIGSFDKLFDFNKDGKLGPFEKTMKMMFLENERDSLEGGSSDESGEESWTGADYGEHSDESWEKDDWAL